MSSMSFVMADNEGRSADSGNGVCQSEGLAAAGYSKKGLLSIPLFNASYQPFNSLGLVSGRFKISMD
jgi:hypothetical protein